ncbi:MAG TPA: proton-conducting transporter membrane subunit, partial [Bacillota bacterium]|nr:proton-conducting transporter membrane subunit [Bacillota bacterium]
MSMLLLTCVLLPLFASVIVYPIGKKNNNAGYAVSCVVCGAVLACAAVLLLVPEGIEYMRPSVMTDFWGFSSNRFNTVLLSAAAVMWFVTTVFAKPYFAPHGGIPARYLSFTLATLGATAGVFLAADLITLLTCFEIMSFTSFVWVIQEETQQARRAASTYLAIAVLGGMSMLAGMFILWHECGTLQLSALEGASGSGVFTAAVLMLVGFGAKAGM